MKKFFISLLSLLLTLSTVNVIKADSSVIYDELIFDENHKVEDIYPLLPDTKLEYGDTYINKEDIRVALETQNKMNALRTGGERWELVRSKPLYDYGDLKCKLLNMVSAGMTESKSSEYTFTISGVVKGYTLTGTFSYTTSYTYSGPTGTENVGNYKATHRMFIDVASGKIMSNTFNVYDTYSGRLLRTVTQNVITNREDTIYGALANVNVGGNYMILLSLNSSNVHWFNGDSNKSWKTVFESILEGSNGYAYIFF